MIKKFFFIFAICISCTSLMNAADAKRILEERAQHLKENQSTILGAQQLLAVARNMVGDQNQSIDKNNVEKLLRIQALLKISTKHISAPDVSVHTRGQYAAGCDVTVETYSEIYRPLCQRPLYETTTKKWRTETGVLGNKYFPYTENKTFAEMFEHYSICLQNEARNIEEQLVENEDDLKQLEQIES